MDDHWLFVRQVIEDDDFQQLSAPIWADKQIATVAGHHADGVSHRVQDVVVLDTMLACAVRDLHTETR